MRRRTSAALVVRWLFTVLGASSIHLRGLNRRSSQGAAMARRRSLRFSVMRPSRNADRPITRVSAPARTAWRMFSGFSPPSATHSIASIPGICFPRRIFSRAWGRNSGSGTSGSVVRITTKARWGRRSARSGSGVAGLKARPASAPASAIMRRVRRGYGQASKWTEIRLAPSRASWGQIHSGATPIMWTSKGRRVSGRRSAMIFVPRVITGTKLPSSTSKWIRSAPASSRMWTTSPRRSNGAAASEGARRGIRLRPRLAAGFFRQRHERADALPIDRVPYVAILLERRPDHNAIGNGELLAHVRVPNAGVGEDGGIGHGLLNDLERLRGGLAAGDEARDAQSIGPGVEHGGAGDVGDMTGAQVAGGFRDDIEEQPHRLGADGVLMADDLAAVGVPQAEIASVDAGEDLTDEGGAGGHRQVQRGYRVPQDIHPEGEAHLGAELGDDPGHRSDGDGLYLREIGKAGLVGEHHRVDAAVLEGIQIGPGLFHHPAHALPEVVVGVAGERLEVAHGDDRLGGAEE